MTIETHGRIGKLLAATQPTALFIATPTSGPAPLWVTFTDQSIGEITSRQWDFDGDGLADSTEINPTHTYVDERVYTVSLTVSNANGSDSKTIADYVTAYSAPNVGDSNNFSRGTEMAKKFGIHEIALTGNGSVSNPFDTDCTVTFTPPSGSMNAVSVKAFYDGGDTWRVIFIFQKQEHGIGYRVLQTMLV